MDEPEFKLTLHQLPTRAGQADGYADREWDRFLSVAIPTPNGRGWYDPSEGPDMPSGIRGGLWQAFLDDCGRLGKVNT